MRATRPLLAAAIAALVAACGGGGGDSAEEVLAETAGRLDRIRSGTLALSLLVTPHADERGAFGFRVEGPFALARAGRLPKLDVEYTQIAGGNSATVGIVSTGAKAYIRVGRAVYELPRAQHEALAQATRAVASDGGLEALPLDDWIVDPELEEGDRTDRVRGRLDVVAAVNGLAKLARSFGREVPPVRGTDADRLREATRSTAFELASGADDRLLRRLRLEADFALGVPRDLRAALGELVGAKVEFRLAVSRPNAAVRVEAPENARPASELPGG